MAKRRRRPAARQSGCPCGTGRDYEACCAPVLGDPSTANTPEALMRSRYTAHVRGDVAHIERTWHPEHRPARIAHDPTVRWLGLEIVEAPVAGTTAGDVGVVEFVARFRHEGDEQQLHERSRFVLTPDGWRYTDGELVPPG